MTCLTCRFYHQTKPQLLQGFCLAYPPSINQHPVTGRLGVGLFPIVRDDMWCGEWNEREREEGELENGTNAA
jgi:hypothetical protein